MAEVERWNGETAQRWIANRERLLALRQHLTPRLFDAAAISPGDRVLDVGCGCGEVTIAAARAAASPGHHESPSRLNSAAGAVPAGSVHGIDLSAPLLEVARGLIADAGVTNIELTLADAQRHPLPPAAHDVVISSFGVMFFDDPLVAFRNLRTSLRSGGRLAFLCWQDAAQNGVFSIPMRAFTAETGFAPPVETDPFADPEWVTELLTHAGFADARAVALHEPAWIGSDPADARDYARGSSRFQALLARLDSDQQAEAVLARMTDEYAARHAADGVWVQAAAWLVGASA